MQLLSAGHIVRTTIRSLSKEDGIRKVLQGAGAENINRLSFCAADLTKDDGWAEAISGCTYVHHVASPFPATQPKSEDELIVPAREGTLRILRAARDAGVKRVVVTSSFAAVGYGPQEKEVYTEEDWSPEEGLPAYHKSKILAERAAWDFMQKEGGELELTVTHPVGIFGPVLGDDFAVSIDVVKRLLDGGVPACPRIYFNMIDVRDLADLHIRAMLDPAAKGQRFLGCIDGRPVPYIDIARIIKERRPEKAQKVPTRQMPSWAVRALALVFSPAQLTLPMLDKMKQISNEKAKTTLGWQPRPFEDTILDTVDSLGRHGIV